MLTKYSNFLSQLPALNTQFDENSLISRNLNETTVSNGTAKLKIVEINEVNSESEQENNSGSSRPHKTQNTIKNLGNTKHEKEESFEIRPEMRHAALDLCRRGLKKKLEVKDENCEIVSNPSKIRECRVILKDIRDEITNQKLSLFQEVQLNHLEQNKKKCSENEKKKCKFCRKKLSTKSNLIYHIKSFHSSELKLLHCIICDQKFIRRNLLESHMNKKHYNGKSEEFECDFCGKVCKAKGNINMHMKVHLPPIKCEICQRIVKITSMRDHKINLHSKDHKFECKMCPKSFKSVQYLKVHEKTHNKKFKCEICIKMFPSQSYLNDHKRKYHENPKSFECEICCRKFNQKTYLNCHQKTHQKSRLKPFKCHRCDFSTDRKQSFRVHQDFHERQDKKFAAMKNPLKCEECPTFHKNKELLKQHMNRVHTKVLFQCDLCAKFLEIKRNLESHMKTCIKKLKFRK